MDTRELAQYVGVNEKQVYTLINDRGLPGTKVTGKWLFPRHLVDRWIEANVANTPQPSSLLEGAKGLLLIAGSDDILLSRLLALYRKRFTETIPLQSGAGSSEGLIALKRGLCHIACIHLPEYHGVYKAELLRESAGPDAIAVTFAERRQGLILPRDNPMGIKDIGDTADRKAVWALREPGTGTRLLFEKKMDQAGCSMKGLSERSIVTGSHIETGIAVLMGNADIGLGIEGAARLLDLAFIPVHEESFDLVIRRNSFFERPVQNLLELLNSDDFADTARLLGGYDISESGKILAQ